MKPRGVVVLVLVVSLFSGRVPFVSAGVFTLASQAHRAVWKVHTAGYDVGTGFFIEGDWFVTNFHVAFSPYLQQGDRLLISQEGAAGQAIPLGQVVALSVLYDLVIFKTKGLDGGPFLKLHKGSSLPQEDEDLFLFSYPLGHFREITKTGRLKLQGRVPVFAVDHCLLAGASGSPVLNRDEEVVGVAFGADSNMLSMTPHVHLKQILAGKVGTVCQGGDLLPRRPRGRVAPSPFSEEECFEREIHNLKQQAEGGLASAQYVLALLYESDFPARGFAGGGGDLSRKWMERAALGNMAKAQNDLGLMYYKARGPYLRQAFDWLSKAAQAGLPSAQLNLGVAFYQNHTSPHYNPQKAFSWVQEAALQGHSMAQFHLALMHYRGTGTSRSLRQTFTWMERAAQAGYAPAQHNLGLMYKQGNGTKTNMQKALMWIRRAAHQGWRPARHNLHLIKKELKSR